jgi:hypothetical protein
MKTKKFYAVEVFDNTCNDYFHDSGVYGKGDYSWMTNRLNGGENVDYTMTLEEAESVKEDFERVIREEKLEWASVGIDEREVPVFDTLQDVADYYNESEEFVTPYIEELIESKGWVSDCGTQWGICHSDTQKVVINENGEAEVI